MDTETIRDPASLSDGALAAELSRLGIPFVDAWDGDTLRQQPTPEALLAALATSGEARLRMALIPLFLMRPDFIQPLIQVIKGVPAKGRVILMCYYTAAVLLQRKYIQRLSRLGITHDDLPHLFDYELHLSPSDDVDALLIQLAERHAELSGRSLNWRGTYEQAAKRFMQRLQQERTWAMS